MITLLIFEWDILSGKCEPKSWIKNKPKNKQTKTTNMPIVKSKLNPYINDDKIVT